MARLIFKDKNDFQKYGARFRGTGRMMILDVEETHGLILRPTVTSKGVDTAEITGLSNGDKAKLLEGFDGDVFLIERIVWREDDVDMRVAGRGE